MGFTAMDVRALQSKRRCGRGRKGNGSGVDEPYPSSTGIILCRGCPICSMASERRASTRAPAVPKGQRATYAVCNPGQPGSTIRRWSAAQPDNSATPIGLGECPACAVPIGVRSSGRLSAESFFLSAIPAERLAD